MITAIDSILGRFNWIQLTIQGFFEKTMYLLRKPTIEQKTRTE
jgi:hypothetical protein